MTPARASHRLLALAALFTAAGCGGGDATSQAQDPNLFAVKRDDLPITVRENAELQALRETIVRSEVEGQATIIYIVPEGTLVKQGEKLVELDVSELIDKRANQEITVERALSALEQAKTQQDILEKELTTKRNTAASQLRIAAMELEKLLGAKGGKGASEGKNADMVKRLRELVSEAPASPPAPAVAPQATGTPANGTPATGTPANGSADGTANGSAATTGPSPTADLVTQVDPRNYHGLVDRVVQLLDVVATAGGKHEDPLERDMGDIANKVLQQTDKIRLAMADLKVKEDTFSHSLRLASKQFITRNELERDRLAYQSQVSQVTIAWNDLELLVNYTLQTERIKCEQDLENMKLELERVEASNDAERKKSTFDIDAKAKEYKVAKERLDNLERQIKSAIMIAPTPGTVVYARLDRNRGGDSVREGVQVRERQELIILPDTTKMRCIIKVQEAQVDKVARGQAALITAEAFQGEQFTGHVTSVAPVADSNSGWMTSDRKVYTTMVELDSDNTDGRLRSRMAANVTIMVDTVKSTLPVPLQAVFRDRSVNYVWREGPDGPAAVPIRAGRQNSERVEVIEGIKEGDVVHLRVPVGVQPPKLAQPALPAPPVKQSEAAAPAERGSGSNGNAAAGNGSGPAPNAGPGNEKDANGQRGQRRPGMGGMNKKLAEMTPEELESYKGMLANMDGFVERMRDTNAEKAGEAEAALAALRKALDANDLATAQTHKDKLGSLMRASRGNGPGGNGPGGNGPGSGGGNGGGGGNGAGGDRGDRGDRARRGNGGNTGDEKPN